MTVIYMEVFFMRNILSDIYRGKYTVIQKHNRKGTPFANLLDQSNELEMRIRKDLPESLRDVFDQYVKFNADLAYLACEEDFIAGYKLGVRLILAALENNQDNSSKDIPN